MSSARYSSSSTQNAILIECNQKREPNDSCSNFVQFWFVPAPFAFPISHTHSAAVKISSIPAGPIVVLAHSDRMILIIMVRPLIINFQVAESWNFVRIVMALRYLSISRVLFVQFSTVCGHFPIFNKLRRRANVIVKSVMHFAAGNFAYPSHRQSHRIEVFKANPKPASKTLPC